MTDIIIPRLPAYSNQFRDNSYDPSPSLFKCGPCAGAMCVDFAYPGRYDVNRIAHDEYVKLVGPDVRSDEQGVTTPIMKQFFADFHVGIIDMQSLVDEGLNNGNYQPLYDEIEAQNKQGVIQFLSVQDESLLIDDSTGASLHPGLHYGHCIVRLGFSTNEGYGLYYDPAAPQQCTDPKSGKNVPVKISWANSIAKARINCCFAIMPPAVEPPPAGFSFQKAQWPAPQKPAPDLTKLAGTLASMGVTLAQMQTLIASFADEVKAAQGEV